MVSPVQRNESLQASPNNQPARHNPQGTVADAQQVASQLAAQLPSAVGNLTARVRPAQSQETQDCAQASKRQRLDHSANQPNQVEEIKGLLQLPKEVIQRLLTFLDSNSRNHSLVLVNKELKNLVREQQHHQAQQIGALSPLPKETIKGVLTFLDSDSKNNSFALVNKVLKNIVREQQRVVTAPCNEVNQALTPFRKVEQIKITSVPRIEDIEGILDSPGTRQIQHLEFSVQNSVTDASLIALVARFPNCTSLNLHAQRQLTNDGIIALAEACPNLASLSLEFCERITDVAIVALAQRCPNLVSLSLTDCSISDSAVLALAAGCPGLSALYLAGCEQITDAAVVALSERYTNFKTLALGGDDQYVSDEAIEQMVRRNPTLDLIMEF
jgi:hypothetical protein